MINDQFSMKNQNFKHCVYNQRKMRVEQKLLPGWEGILMSEKHQQEKRPKRRVFYPIRPPTDQEIFAHLTPLLKFQFRKWIEKVEKEEFSLKEIFNPKVDEDSQSLSLIRLYLFPQPPKNRPLNQEEVIPIVFGDPRVGRAQFKERLILSLIRIKRREKVGDRAVEVLQLSDFLYWSIAGRGLPEGKKIYTIDQIYDLSPEELERVCGARPMFEELKEKMSKKFPNWNPKVVFPFES